MPMDHMQTTAGKMAAGTENDAPSRLYAPGGRLCRFGELFDIGNPHCAQSNAESFADFLFVPVIDGNRRPIGASEGSGVLGTTLALNCDGVVRLC